MRTGFARRAAVALSSLLVLGITPSGLSQASASPCALENYRVKTFHVTMKSAKPSYKKGEKTNIEISVSRPAHEDPFDQGIETGEPPFSEPAEGVTVGIGIFIKDVYFNQAVITNADGKGTAKIKLEKWTPKGATAAVRAYASLRQVEQGCVIIDEWGYAEDPALFKVKK